MKSIGEGIFIEISNNTITINRVITFKYLIISMIFVFGLMNFCNLNFTLISIVELVMLLFYLPLRKTKVIDTRKGQIDTFYSYFKIRVSNSIPQPINKVDNLIIVYKRNQNITEDFEVPYSVYLRESYDDIAIMSVNSFSTIVKLTETLKKSGIVISQI